MEKFKPLRKQIALGIFVFFIALVSSGCSYQVVKEQGVKELKFKINELELEVEKLKVDLDIKEDIISALEVEKENTSTNEINLSKCLAEADDDFLTNFIVICRNNEGVNGGKPSDCWKSNLEDSLGYSAVSTFKSLFAPIVDKRDKERQECIQLYK